MKHTIYEFEILRIFAICGIIIFHQSQSIPAYPAIASHMGLFGWSGNAIFFFIAGFLISGIEIYRPLDVALSMKKRLFRLMPLYYSYLILYCILMISKYGYQVLDIRNVVVHALFLQTFLTAPNNTIGPLWFVGVLLIYTLIVFSSRLFFGHSINGIIYLLLWALPLRTLHDLQYLPSMASDYYPFFMGAAILGAGYAGQIGSLPKWILAISGSTYAAYLFHLMIIEDLSPPIAAYLGIHDFAIYCLMSIVMVFAISIIITWMEKKMRHGLKRRTP